jgi:CHAD domain-containing protein
MLAQLEPEPRHQLRIEIKKLRYAVEFLSSLTTGDRALQRQKAFVSALEEMQERLGELNDVETARELLGTLLAELQDVQSLQFAQRQLGDAGPESRQLKAAEQAFVKLTDIGRFWR